MEYIEVICPHCKKSIEFKLDGSVRKCPLCGGGVVRNEESGIDDCHESKVTCAADGRLSDAYEEGVKKGREAERKREADEAKTYLWAAIVLGAIGGGVIGWGMDGLPDQRIMRVVVGILLGGFVGGLHHIFGCFLTLVIFIVGAVGVVACIAL